MEYIRLIVRECVIICVYQFGAITHSSIYNRIYSSLSPSIGSKVVLFFFCHQAFLLLKKLKSNVVVVYRL